MGNIVLVGVGGAGMSACARLFLQLGFKNIVGIDKYESELTKTLEKEGLHITIGHGIYKVGKDDFMIYSAATEESEEVQAKKVFAKDKIPTPPLTYFQFIGEISKYFNTLAIAGTHGKSTTSALTAHVLAKMDPNFGLGIIGAGLADWNGANMKFSMKHKDDIYDIIHHIVHAKGPNVEHLMKKYTFVIEACEYNRQFLALDVDIAGITNIELDHADVYKDFASYISTFIDFGKHVSGPIITLNSTKGQDILKNSHDEVPISIPIQKFGFKHLLGSHNHANASLALTLAKEILGSSNTQDIQAEIEGFVGLWRRGELLGHNSNGVPIITDYAHHPTELHSTLLAIEEKYPNEHIQLIFQPHQARRVVEFRDEFVTTLQTTTNPIIYTIYTAREEVGDLITYTLSSKTISEKVHDVNSFEELGKLFAEQFDGIYETDFSQIKEKIFSQKTGVTLICTAGNLDRDIRQLV